MSNVPVLGHDDVCMGTISAPTIGELLKKLGLWHEAQASPTLTQVQVTKLCHIYLSVLRPVHPRGLGVSARVHMTRDELTNEAARQRSRERSLWQRRTRLAGSLRVPRLSSG
jgi:hypothetical protein